MRVIRFIHRGDLSATMNFLRKASDLKFKRILNEYGKKGCDALKQATPKDTGKTSESWTYSIQSTVNSVSLIWSNTNVNKGENIAILLQYGHGTRNGGYVAGRDYINPALRPIFDEIAKTLWKEVTDS